MFFHFGLNELRFYFSNAYTPIVNYVDSYSGTLYIVEQGRYKNVLQMEDDINTVIKRFVNKELTCPNYKDLNTEMKALYIVTKYMNKETPFYNNGLIGNNKTLNPLKSEEISKKLKGHHKLIKNPKNIFFTLYSKDNGNIKNLC